MQLVSEVYPDAVASKAITSFTQEGSSGTYYSSVISAEPGINGNEALHTAAIYSSSYIGSVTIQATLDDTIIAGTPWADISTHTFTGSETQPLPVNFNGVLGHIRCRTSANPTDKISKILVRN